MRNVLARVALINGSISLYQWISSIQTPLPVAKQDYGWAPLTKDAGAKVAAGGLYDHDDGCTR